MKIKEIQVTSMGILPQASSYPMVRSLVGEVLDGGTLFFYIFILFVFYYVYYSHVYTQYFFGSMIKLDINFKFDQGRLKQPKHHA